ncbi:MAG: M20/M25/M40 family metallo-hydrolase [Polyangiales bacterium]
MRAYLSPAAVLLMTGVGCSRGPQSVGGPQSSTPDAAATHRDALDPDIAAMRDAVDEGRLAASVQRLAGFGTRNACSALDGGASGIGAARDWIAASLRALPGLEVKLHDFPVTVCPARRTLSNVVAILPGKDPTRAILVGGHYDSRTVDRNDGTSPAPGANDSGSQTALVLEAARVMAGRSFTTTVVFVAFAAEEQGLLGSAALAGDFAALFPGTSLEAVLNCDIVGGDADANDADALQRFRLYSPGTPRETGSAPDGSSDDTSPARGLMRFIAEWGSAYVPAMTIEPKLREDRVGRGGDHEPFLARGVTAVRFIETNETFAHQHTPDDVFAHVTPAYTARVARVVVSVAASLARAPRAPTALAATVDPAGLHLSWTAGAPSSSVERVVVAARPVTESVYTHFVDAAPGPPSALVDPKALGVDGGAFFVSVAAVDAAGHASMFAYPELRCEAGVCAVPAGATDVTAVVK